MAKYIDGKIQNSAAPNSTSIGSFDSIADYTKHGLSEIVEATKAVNAFPTGAARDLYCSYPTFGQVIDKKSDRILGLISKVLRRQNIRGNIQRRQPDEQFEMLLECNDSMLERLGSNLDQFAGIKKKLELVVVESKLQVVRPTAPEVGAGAGSWNKKAGTTVTTMRLTTAHNIPRPQVKFQMHVDNSALTPFVPRLKEKPNSIKPLAILPEYDEDGNIVSYLHPYEFELMRFEVPATFLKRKIVGELPRPLTETSYMYVDNVATLRSALEELRGQPEIAVDVENHSYRSFQGFTCLVQVSTRLKDYLFDALALRDEMHILNEIFTDPKVVKILHGADLDVEWLQRDLSLYIVNLFDTHQAAKLLQFPRLSLAYLLQHYCDIEADKTYQLADWRIRPLPEDFIAYARQDTHFLIYIYERLTNDLLDTSQPNILRSVYQSGTQICSKRYQKPKLGVDSHLDVSRKSKRVFDNRQLYALQELFKWRDALARQEDESYGYVIPNHMMLQIAESLPREMQGILACCNPVPPLVRQNLHVLHQFILRAREQPLVKPMFEKDAIHRVARSSNKEYNDPLHCPHDLSYCAEFRDDLPTLLDSKEILSEAEITKETEHCTTSEQAKRLRPPVLSVFAVTDNAPQRHMLDLGNTIPSLTPYERYLAVLPEIEKEKIAEAARIEEENKKRSLCPEAPQAVNSLRKQEAETKMNDDDDEYSLPVKEYLKRKYEESVAKKEKSKAQQASSDRDRPLAKRMKMDDEMIRVQMPRHLLYQQNKKKQPFPSKTKFEVIDLVDNMDDDDAIEIIDLDSSKNQTIEIIDDGSDSAPEEVPSSSQYHQQKQNANQLQNGVKQQQGQAQSQVQERLNTKKQRKNKRYKSQNKTAQSSSMPITQPHAHFDYQQVDFKKFQGGAKTAIGMPVRGKYQGKNNIKGKAQDKKLNKLFTFSNVRRDGKK